MSNTSPISLLSISKSLVHYNGCTRKGLNILYSSQTFVTQPPKDLFKKYSAIYSLGDLNPNTFCAMLLYLLAYR